MNAKENTTGARSFSHRDTPLSDVVKSVGIPAFFSHINVSDQATARGGL